MRQLICGTRKAAVLLLVLWTILAVLFCSGHLILNTTGSVPRGLWWVSDGRLQRGDIVCIPISAFRSTSWVPEPYWRKNAWGKPKAFLKRVAGLPGDTVESGKYGLIRVAGEVVPNSTPLSADRGGRHLMAFPLPVTLASDEVWLISDSPRGFDSRYLGPAWIEDCHKALPLAVF